MSQTNGLTTTPTTIALSDVEQHAVRAAAALQQHLAELRAMLHDEDAIQAGIRELLEESKHRQSGLKRAIDALDPSPPSTMRQPKRQGKTGYGWTISDTKVEEVLGHLIAYGKPVTAGRLADSVQGLSGEACRRAFEVLRDAGRVRLTGSAQNGGKLYAPMPEEIETANA
jgi:hypothetical protein